MSRAFSFAARAVTAVSRLVGFKAIFARFRRPHGTFHGCGRAEALRLWRSNACGGSARDDGHVHTLVGDAAREIARLRLKLTEADSTYVKARRSAQGHKGGRGRKRLASLAAEERARSMVWPIIAGDRSPWR